MLERIFKHKIFKHKISLGLFVIFLLLGSYYIFKKAQGASTETRYVMGTIQRGTLITTVSGSGQIIVSHQVDIKAKASGDVIKVLAKNGQTVKENAAIAQLDARDTRKAVRDAQINLRSARLSLAKLKQSASAYTALQAKNALASAQSSLEKLRLSQQINYQKATDTKERAQNNLTKEYDDGFNTVANAFLDLPSTMIGLHDVLFGNSFDNYQWNIDWYVNQTTNSDSLSKAILYRDDVTAAYNKARQAYDASFDHYKQASRTSDAQTIENLITETYETTRTIAEAIKVSSNFIDYIRNYMEDANRFISPEITTHQATLSSFTAETNGHLLSLLGIKQSIEDAKQTIVGAGADLRQMEQNNPLDLAAAEAAVQEREASLAELANGTDPLDIQSQELTVQQRINTLADAREKLADYTIRAPFGGVVAKIDLKRGDSLSSGGIAATLITKQQLAQISLNEVDVAKIKVGQKVTLTFDAIDGLSISGQVAEIDALGTVTQGVVTYNVKINFDTQDERVKPGMSVSAAIITNVKQDVLLVPNSAIKTEGAISYVEQFDQKLPEDPGGQGVASQTAPRQQAVEVGLSNDTATEIVSGLKEGDEVVVRTVAQTTNKTQTTQAPSLFGAGGNRSGAGGGTVRFQR